MAKPTEKEAAIKTVEKLTGMNRDEIIAAIPGLNPNAPEAAARPPRGRGSNAVSSDPFGPRFR